MGWFDRHAPRSLVGYLEVYTRWVGQLGTGRRHSMAGKLIRKWIWQMALNLALAAAVFLVAAFLLERPPNWLAGLPGGPGGLKPWLWLTSVLVSVPFLIAIFRKLQALGMLVSEISVSRELAGEKTAAIRGIVAQVIPLAGFVGLGLFVLAMSSTLLPPLEVLALLVLIVILVTGVWWRAFVRLHAKGQIALRETFDQPPVVHREAEASPLQRLLSQTELKTVSIASDSVARGKLIRDVRLRSRSGASIVGIERNGESLINPGPDEELLPDDQVLLLGNPAQLAAAESILKASEPRA